MKYPFDFKMKTFSYVERQDVCKRELKTYFWKLET